MKKLIFLLAFLPVFLVSCSEDDEPQGEQTVMINILWRYKDYGEPRIASPSVVMLYDYETAKNFDKEESVRTMANDVYIVLPDGKKLSPEYVSSDLSGINTFKNVKNGKYLVIAYYKPDGYDWSFAFLYGYNTIDVNNELGTSLYNYVLTWEDSGKFIEMPEEKNIVE